MDPLPTRVPSESDLRPFRDLKDREVDRDGLFIAETMLVAEALLAIPGVGRSVLCSSRMAERVMEMVAASRDPGVPVFVLPLEEMERIAGFHVHRGVLATGDRAALAAHQARALAAQRSLPGMRLALDGICNIDNVGMLFRCAAAFGVKAVLLSAGCHDPLWRKSLRVSIGHALRIPWERTESLAQRLRELREQDGWTILGTSLSPAAEAIESVCPPARGVLVVGHESEGVSPEVAAACDRLVRIRMAPGVDSLNVATAAAVCLHRLAPVTPST